MFQSHVCIHGIRDSGSNRICYVRRSDVVEDVLTTGMVGQFMHYLRVRVLGDTSADASAENKPNVGMSGSRGRDEARGRVRPLLDVSRMEDLRVSEKVSDEQPAEWAGERAPDAKGKRKDSEEGVQEDDENLEGTPDLSLCIYDADEDGDEWMNEDKRRRKDRREAKTRTTEWLNSTRPLPEDETEEIGRAEPSKRRSDAHRGGGKGRGKGRPGDGTVELERGQVSAPTSARKETVTKSRGLSTDKNGTLAERDGVKDDSDSDKEEIQCVMVGNVDISPAMRKAKRAAQAEARTENAPWEAVKAAGDAAADLVRVAATEVLFMLGYLFSVRKNTSRMLLGPYLVYAAGATTASDLSSIIACRFLQKRVKTMKYWQQQMKQL